MRTKGEEVRELGRKEREGESTRRKSVKMKGKKRKSQDWRHMADGTLNVEVRTLLPDGKKDTSGRRGA